MLYQDFELEISAVDAAYQAKVRSPQGEAQQPFTLPDAVTLENLILKMRGFSRSSRAANCPEVQAASRFGELLFSNAFGGEICNLLKSCLDQTSNDKGLRIKLILQDAPELSALPWEYLYLPSKRDFLAHSPTTPIVRYLKHATAIKPLAVTLPLKLLVVTASPSDKAWLDTKAERRALEQALTELVADGTLQITWLEHATVAALAEVLEQNTFHLLHFIGHSYFDDKLTEGALILENAEGKSHYYDASRLKVLLHDHHTLRLVVLNSCEGAMSDEKDPFSSIATTLMLAGIPAVIAMQFEISDAAAISFAKVFYKWLAKGTPIDEAVGKARKYLFAVDGNNVEWGTPVLYLRARDGVLFSVDTSQQDAEAEKRALEQFQQEQFQQEQARLEQLRLEQLRLEQLRLEQEKLARERQERERLAREKAEQDNLNEWCERVFDPDFVASDRYAKLLASEVPPKKYNEALIALYRNRDNGEANKLECIFRTLIELAGDDKIEDFLAVVSDDLKTVQNESSISLAIQILPSRFWSRITEIAKLRIENKLILSIESGRYSDSNNNWMNYFNYGLFGTWAKKLIKDFSLKNELHQTLLKKLDGDELEQNYMAKFFFSSLPDTINSNNRDIITNCYKKACIKAILSAVAKPDCSKALREKFLERNNLPTEWQDLILEEIGSVKESDPEYFEKYINFDNVKDVPF
jgi:hypothetical protein